MANTQRRKAFRVPLRVARDLSAVLEYQEISSIVKPVNISLTGILVGFDKDDAYDLPIGSEVNLTLKFQSETAKISGKIVRRDGNRYGIFFLNSSAGGNDLHAPGSLRKMVRKLERDWIRKRVKV